VVARASAGDDGRRAAGPDQYVAHVLPLDAHEELADFSGGILVDSTT
jgi:hypothetical protein